MKYLLLIVALISSPCLGQLQINKEKSSLKITGTSSLHDWEMVVKEFDASGAITDTEIKDLKVTVKSKSMKSGKSVMDGKAYDAVQADQYPDIVFSAKSLGIEEDSIKGKGLLRIAEKSREVDFSAKIVGNEEGEMQLQGKVSLKMTDFEIKPPTAMFGTLKTGDEVVIHYDIFITK